ncbi:MAG TPA: GGDEF domain-containing protein [Mycobacteriales bacterium]|jgi:diguanylate cyclase (GGDEF)-like protein|nr:GGDEF domain-containing protein [Mycobacteriales bacterium]
MSAAWGRLLDVLRLPHMRLWLQFFVAGLVVCQISFTLLRPGVHDRLLVLAVNLPAQVLIVAGTLALPAESWLNRLWPPIVGLGALIAIGATTTGLAPAVGGFFIIMFVYVGLTQRPWTSLWLVAPAIGGWLLLNRPLDHVVMAKLPVAAGLWILLAELLSRVTAQRQADQDRLAEQAAHDALTGLRNRRGLDELLDDAHPGDAVVFIDLDYFKTVNDLLGHEAGDHVIADLGRIVLAVLRPDDVAVRYGGEEVLVLLPATSVDGAETMLRRLRRGWAASHPELTFSAGIAIVDHDGGAAAAREADNALYLAKQRGRNRSEVAGQTPPALIPTQKGSAQTSTVS